MCLLLGLTTATGQGPGSQRGTQVGAAPVPATGRSGNEESWVFSQFHLEAEGSSVRRWGPGGKSKTLKPAQGKP